MWIIGIVGLLVLIVVVGLLVAWMGRWFFVLPLMVVALLPFERRYRRRQRQQTVRRTIQLLHQEHGHDKDILVVYSDSVRWQPHIEGTWVPRWGHRMVLFNRSKPWHRGQIEFQLWQAALRGREHTPMAILLNGPRAGEGIELYSAFRDARRGKPERLAAAEQAIEVALKDMQGGVTSAPTPT